MELPTISGNGAAGNGAAGGAIGEDSPPDAIVAWTLERFAHHRMLTTTQFGMEGCALIDLYARQGKPFTVVYLDTMFFFPETYRLRDRLVQKYPHVTFINSGTSMTPEEQEKLHGPELWKTNPTLCCQIRKVDPMGEVMKNVDVWITGLRRTQSSTRAALKVVDWDWKYEVLKISPLANWERADVWTYIKSNDVPYNELHEKEYPTIGCTHCTQPVPGSRPGDYSRAGRWAGLEKTECGLHGGAGI